MLLRDGYQWKSAQLLISGRFYMVPQKVSSRIETSGHGSNLLINTRFIVIFSICHYLTPASRDHSTSKLLWHRPYFSICFWWNPEEHIWKADDSWVSVLCSEWQHPKKGVPLQTTELRFPPGLNSYGPRLIFLEEARLPNTHYLKVPHLFKSEGGSHSLSQVPGHIVFSLLSLLMPLVFPIF